MSDVGGHQSTTWVNRAPTVTTPVAHGTCRDASGASLAMLMAKSRRKKLEKVRRYFLPSAEAVAVVTSLLAPGNSRRWGLGQG